MIGVSKLTACEGTFAQYFQMQRGNKLRFYSPDFGGHSFPILLVSGEREGPTVFVSAGIHGSEYCAIEAAQRFSKIDSSRICGNLIVVPIVNMPAFENRSVYVNPLDAMNMNRIFPGDIDGSISERVVHWIMQEIVVHCDAWIDLHCGDLSEVVAPFTLFCDGDGPSRKLAQDFGLPSAISSSASGMSICGGSSLGVPTIIAEAGGAGIFDELAINRLVNGLKRACDTLGMLSSETSSSFDVDEVIFYTCKTLTADTSGIWYPERSVGSILCEGDLVGTITNFWGDSVRSVRAMTAGILLYHLTSYAVNQGEVLGWIGETESSNKVTNHL